MNKWLGGILSEPLYCVTTMLDARYKDRYFNADKKHGLREMLQTQLDKTEMDTVTVHTQEESPLTDRAETSLLDMYDEILVETEQMNNKTAQQVSERNRFWLCYTGNGDICKCQQNNFLVSMRVCFNYLTVPERLKGR